jgi:hypothetical protein
MAIVAVPLDGKNDESIIRNARFQLLKDHTHIDVALKGTRLPPEKVRRLEKQVQTMLATELEKREHVESRMTEIVDQTSPPGGVISVSLSGLGLSGEDAQFLEGRVSQFLTNKLGTQMLSAPQICVCAFSGVPGSTVPIPPHSTNPWFFAIVSPEDAISVTVENGFVATDQVVVGLLNTCPSGWDKQIEALNLCAGPIASITQGTKNTNPTFMTLSSGCFLTDTLILRKPKFFGVWSDMYNYSATAFWSNFGGTRVSHTWLRD